MSFGSKTHGGMQPLRTRIKDEKGHYERWPEVRVHPDLDTAAKALLADSACDYESMADLVRGSVIEAIARSKVSNPNTKSIRAVFLAIDEENRQMAMRRRFKQRIEETAKEAYELVGEGRANEAAKHVHKVLMHIRSMDEEDSWRKEFEKTIMTKFGYLLRMTQAASLVPEEDEMALERYVETTH